MEEKKGLSRRKFIAGAGALAAGAAVSGALLGLGSQSFASSDAPVRVMVNGKELAGKILSGRAYAPVRQFAECLGATVGWEATSRTVTVKLGAAAGAQPATAAETAAAAPKFPWPYKKLDPEVVRRKGYDGYYEGACCYGAVKAIITELQNVVGYPYTIFPIDMFKYGEGGVVGWASLCGALNGASAVINLVGGEDFKTLVDELVGWYTQNPFPSDKHDKYSKYPGQVQSISGSPLCHVSVTNWCKASGYKAFSKERSERCAKLTGDVAARAVELLNTWADGKFVAAFKLPTEVETCRGCHDKGSKLENTRGKMNCVQCHEPHLKS